MISFFDTVSTAWTPAIIRPRLTAWYDAADQKTIVSSGGSVSQWSDKSGNDFHLSQANAANQPTYNATGLNGKPTLITDGADNLIRSNVPILKNVGQGNVIVVLEYASNVVFSNLRNEFIIRTSLGATRMAISPQLTLNTQSIGGRRLDGDSFAIVNSSTDSNALRGTPFFKVAQLDYQNAQANHWTNGTQDLTASAFLTAGNTSNTNASSVEVFGQLGAYIDANTKISEVIIIENTLSTENRQKIEGYLAWKWGLFTNLPSDHPFRYHRPMR